jgi:hypothetical protein
MRPAINPTAMHPKISVKIFLCACPSFEMKINSSGKEDLVKIYRQGTRRMVEKINCFFSYP